MGRTKYGAVVLFSTMPDPQDSRLHACCRLVQPRFSEWACATRSVKPLFDLLLSRPNANTYRYYSCVTWYILPGMLLFYDIKNHILPPGIVRAYQVYQVYAVACWCIPFDTRRIYTPRAEYPAHAQQPLFKNVFCKSFYEFRVYLRLPESRK